MKIIGPMAGIGARLRPFTFNKPKALLKVAGKRVIDHILELLSDVSEKAQDLLIITGYRKRTIEEYLSAAFSDRFKLSFINQEPEGYIGDIPYFGGLGQAIYLSRDWYLEKLSPNSPPNGINESSLIFLSDMIPIDGYKGLELILSGKYEEWKRYCENRGYMIRLLELLGIDNNKDHNKVQNKDNNKDNNRDNNNQIEISQIFPKKVDGVLGVMEVPPDMAKFYGIIQLKDRTLLIDNMVEKPQEYISDLAIAGAYAFTSEAMEQLFINLEEDIKNNKDSNKEVQFTPSIQKLINQGYNIVALPLFGGVLDFGNPRTLLEGNRFLLEKTNTDLEDSSISIINSKVIPPVHIGKNVTIRNSVVGPYCSVGDNTLLGNCIVQNCVIGDECVLDRIITAHSIIGDNVSMDALIKDNLMIGDRTNISNIKM